jgi:hypothetical protein
LLYALANGPSRERKIIVKECTHCGNQNEDTSLLCACGQDLTRGAAPDPAAHAGSEAGPHAAESRKEPRLVLRKLLFVIGSLALVALYALFRHRLKTSPLYSSLVVTGVWCATAVAGLRFLGREERALLRAWRIGLLVTATYFLPLILNIADGLVEFGWPSGRFNRPIAKILTLLIPLSASAFLTGLVMHIRAYRVAGALAFLSGIASIVLGAYLIPATQSLRRLSITLGEVLNNVMFQAKYETYAAIPMGLALLIGGVLIFWKTRARAGG